MITSTEVAVIGGKKAEEKAEREAARLNRAAFTWQRYTVEAGIRPGTFAVVLVDSDSVRPDRSITGPVSTRKRENIRGAMRSDVADTLSSRGTFRLIG